MRRLLILFVLISGLQAEFDKVATTAAPFLKMGVGARAVSMGGGFVALANDGSSIYWNPAGMTHTQGMTISASHNDWMLDLSHDYVGFIISTSPNGKIGLSVTSLTMGEQPVRTLQNPEGTGIKYGVQDLNFNLAYARRITDRLSFGMTLKMVQLQAFNESARSFAMDIGSILETDFYGLKIGMALSNFGGDIQYAGRDLIVDTDIDTDIDGNYNSDADLRTEPWPLPLMVRIGVSMDIVGSDEAVMKSSMSRLTMALDADHPNDGPEHLNGGLEYSYREMVFLRAGYRHKYDLESFTMGVGTQLELRGLGKVRVDYAVIPKERFGSTSILSVEFQK